MDVLDASNDLLVDTNGGFFVEALVLHNIVEEFSVAAVLHYQVKLCFGLDDLHKRI